MKRRVIVSVLLILCLLSGCGSMLLSEEEKTVSLFAMDTHMTMTAYGNQAEEALDSAKGCIEELEKALSVTDENSEIYRVNHSKGSPVTVGDDTKEVTEFALIMAECTNGAFNPAIYPLLTAWGFTTGNYHVPSQQQIEQLLELTDYNQIVLTGNEITIPPEMQLDLGAVGKGYASDRAAETLKNQGVTSAIINLGGNVRTIGAKPDGTPWRVGVKAPDEDGHIGILEVSDCAVITSGGYQKYFTDETGTRYHHIIDPQTGKPAERGIVSATVVGKEGKMCDALSTALFIMGVEKAAEFWREYRDFEMVLITDNNEIYITEGLEDSFSLQEEYSLYTLMVLGP